LYLSFFVLKVKPGSDFPEPLDGSTVESSEEKVAIKRPKLAKPKMEPQLAIKGKI